MAKKKRKTGGQLAEVPGGGHNAGAADSGDADLDITLRAVHWLAADSKGLAVAAPSADGQALLEALQPMILARAEKYEADAEAAGTTMKVPGAASAADSRKRQQQVMLSSGHDDDFEPEDEMADAMKAIASLSGKLEALNSKEYKQLRAALHPLVEAHLREENASPAFRITRMLGQRNRWANALPLLAELRTVAPGKRPKLGAYMRWVRELNVAIGGPQEVAMLDAMMRCAAGLPASSTKSPVEGVLKEFPPFECPAARASGSKEPPVASSHARAEVAAGAFSVIAHEAAHERKPPNHFDLDIFTCAPGVINLSAPPTQEAARHSVPGVEGAFALAHVLSGTECASIRGLTEAVGFRPDLPLSSIPDERAQNVVLLASEADNNALFTRVRDLLPPKLEGESLVGLNRRWRIYRYKEGNVYRKHLDGAWPASGTELGAGGKEEYLYDAYGGKQWSRLTFIVYLNDDFEGGCTTFFVPNPKSDGELEARPVRPLTGAASVFVHGDTGVLLLHEGSPVTSGSKYLLRTEVMYESAQSTAERKADRLHRGLARQHIGFQGSVSGRTEAEENSDADASGAEEDDNAPRKKKAKGKGKGKGVIKKLKNSGRSSNSKNNMANKLAAGQGMFTKKIKKLKPGRRGKKKDITNTI